ncbi:MAG: peptidase M16 [Halioglobus sp.]|nr:peptidase M16 [Halioglobus sp.]
MSPQIFPRATRALAGLLLSVLVASCASLGGSGQQPVQSPSDDYGYRMLTLDNGLQVLLVSDPDTPKAAASLDVMVGSGDNPPGRAGLAHFLEHMLFLGTDKYPDAAEYEEYITEHGGNRNAYTSLENTNYFFDINPEHLPEALDRFAQFFIAPRFDAEYVDREKNAVQAEYQMGLKSDPRRGLDVLQSVMNPEHPFSQFTVGSLETLADREESSIRDELLQFYAKHYSANVMRLVVLGADSLDELENLVVPMFSEVPNRSAEPDPIDVPMFEPESLPKFVQVKPLATQRQLELSFPVPEYRKDYRAKPLGYLGNLVGHEGEGSLLSQLKAEGLAESLSAGTGIAWRGGSLFSVGVALTEKGAANTDRIIQLFFAYIDVLRAAGPQQWLFEEQAQLAELGFRFKEQSSPMRYVSRLASGMHHYPAVDILRGPYRMDSYNAEQLADLVARINPDNMLVTLSDASVEGDLESPFYGVSYSVETFDTASLAVDAADPALAALHLPGPNEFIADDLSLVELEQDAPAVPVLAHESVGQKIWYRQDDEFRLPKGVIQIGFRAPGVNDSVASSAKAALYASLLSDKVNEFAYPAQLAGLGFGINKLSRGLSVRVSGYNDKQQLLLSRLLANVKAPAFDPERFENVRRDMIRSLKNSVAQRPSSQVMTDLREALHYGRWDERAHIDALENTDLDALNDWIGAFWQRASAEALVFGNYAAGEVDTVAAILANVLPAQPGEVPAKQLLRLDPGEALQYRVDVPHDDAVLAWYLQGRGKSWDDRAATALAGQVMKSGFFQQLRTEQQLGYVVSAFSWAQLNVPGLVMLIQSPVADAAALATAMEEFMQGVQPGLDEAQFERHKEALVSDILRPDKNIGERADYYWRAINARQLDFESRAQLAAAVRALSLADWSAYYRETFLEERHSLQVISPGRWDLFPAPAGATFDSAQSLKSGHSTYTAHW